MSDGDWSNIPREVIDIDTLGPPDVLFVGYIGEDNGAFITIVYNTFYLGLFDGDQLVLTGTFPYVTLIDPLSFYAVIGNGLYYTGAFGEIIPYPFELPPIAEGQLSGASLIFIPFHCDEVNNEYWG
jgi:hypothetical protein